MAPDVPGSDSASGTAGFETSGNADMDSYLSKWRQWNQTKVHIFNLKAKCPHSTPRSCASITVWCFYQRVTNCYRGNTHILHRDWACRAGVVMHLDVSLNGKFDKFTTVIPRGIQITVHIRQSHRLHPTANSPIGKDLSELGGKLQDRIIDKSSNTVMSDERQKKMKITICSSRLGFVMVSNTVLTNLLLASAALAAPSFEVHAAGRQPSTIQDFEAPVNVNLVRRDHRLGIWAGAVYNDVPNTFKAVYGVITIPSSGSASIWVGIDGDTCRDSILQAGIDFTLPGGYNAWYKVYPGDVQAAFPGAIDFSPNDVVKLTVFSDPNTLTTGTAMIENISTGLTVTQQIIFNHPLCQQDAEWVVQNRHLDDLADFGTIVFTDAYAVKRYGKHVGAGGANTTDIQQGDNILTSSSVGTDSITIKYS